MLRRLLVASALFLPASLYAQAVDESALDALDRDGRSNVSNAREPAGAVQLRAAMRRIAMQPDDADALADAGNASLQLGDANAALNFYTRANALRPRNGKIVSGLAAATVRTENPFEALRLFDEAVKLGVNERTIAADRALAFDLLGNFGRAQQDYQLARSAAASDDLVVRQAISLSLSGQKEKADAMLVPLLDRNDPSAWRARAFMLAARGDLRESTKVAQGFMDPRSVQKLERYLRLMPDLTGAQQAAAIHLGHFPASNIGRDSEAVRRVAATIPNAQPAPSAGQSRLIPAGEPLGKKPASRKQVEEDRKAQRRRDRRAREEAEEAAEKPEPQTPAKIAARRDDGGLATDRARAAVENASTARAASVSGSQLPPPETARPLVSVPIPQVSARPAPAAGTPPASVPVGRGGPVAAPPPIVIAPEFLRGTAISGPPAAAAASTSPPPSSTLPASAAASLPAGAPANSGSASSPALQASAPVSSPAPQQGSAPVSSAPAAVQGPAISGAPVAAISAPVAAIPASSPPAASQVPTFDLASIVSSIEIPESEQKPSVVPVDLSKLKPAPPKVAAADTTTKAVKADPKAAAKPAAKPAAPAQPARFWVQIATGEVGALGFDYRKIAKKNPDLFKNRDGWTSAWGRTSRLLVGPFADLKASKKWEADYRKTGGDAFAWKSDNGVVVTALKGK